MIKGLKALMTHTTTKTISRVLVGILVAGALEIYKREQAKAARRGK